MKLISSKVHGLLDYISVVVLALSPQLFGMRFYPGALSYALACVHFVLTFFTDFEFGFVRMIPLRIHGAIEVSVSVVLLLVAGLFAFQHDATAFYFYATFALFLFFVWLFSSYKIAPVSQHNKLREDKNIAA